MASVIGDALHLNEYTQSKSILNFSSILFNSFMLNLGYGDPYEVKVELPWKPKKM